MTIDVRPDDPTPVAVSKNGAAGMSEPSYTTGFTVVQSPVEVFDAVIDVRGWWSGEIEGDTDRLGAEFTYRYQDLHRSRQRIIELVPGERVVWHVLDAEISFVRDKNEWDGTDIVFEIAGGVDGTELRFTHRGLTPGIECYGKCAGAWGFYVNESLRDRIVSGAGQPKLRER